MSTYKTGTVSVTNGSATVVGTGTAWAVALVAGGMFSCAGIAVPIASVTDDTHIVLDYNWPGTTASGAAYSIALENSSAASVVSLNTTLSRVLVQLSLAGITPDASGSLTDRAAITLGVGDKGFLFLHAEIGVAFAFYRWTGTAWDGPFAVANASNGPVSSLAAGTGITVDATNPAIPVVSATRPLTGKTTPVDADEVSLFDSAASYVLKRLTWANLKAGVWSALGALISGGTAKTTPVDADTFALSDSAASSATKKLTWANLKATFVATANTWSGGQTYSAAAQYNGSFGVGRPGSAVGGLYFNRDPDNPFMLWSYGTSPGTAIAQLRASGANGIIGFTEPSGGVYGLSFNPTSQVTSITGSLTRGAPVTKTADFTVAATENWLINNKSGSTCTVTLPSASSFSGREIYIKNMQAQTVVSASSNVVPRNSTSAGTAILASGAGNWALLVSDGTNWVAMAGS